MRTMPDFLWISGLADGPLGACWISLPGQGFRMALTFLYRHLMDVSCGTVLELDHLSFKQLLSCGGGKRENRARHRGALRAAGLFAAKASESQNYGLQG